MFLKYLSPDRRRQNRQLFNASVRVITELGHIDAIGINISDVGMCLFTVAKLPVNTNVEVEFPAPHNAHGRRIRGMIRYRALYLYGIEFLRDSDQETVDPAVQSSFMDETTVGSTEGR
jgi:hypothetical protein